MNKVIIFIVWQPPYTIIWIWIDFSLLLMDLNKIIFGHLYECYINFIDVVLLYLNLFDDKEQKGRWFNVFNKNLAYYNKYIIIMIDTYKHIL